MDPNWGQATGVKVVLLKLPATGVVTVAAILMTVGTDSELV